MIQKLLCCVSSIILLIGCSSTEKIPPKSPILCSLLSFESRAGVKEEEAESITDMISEALQNTGRFTIVERKKMNAVVQEQGFQSIQSGEDAAKAGKILAVQKMFSGSIGMLGKKYIVNLKMIDVESSRVDFVRSWTYDDDLEDIGKEFFPHIAQEVVKIIDGLKSH
jgi:TolB-like protein